MSILEQHLGRCLSAREVSQYLRCDISTVYRHFHALGGVKVGSCYKFFEKRLLNAILEQEETAVDSASAVQWQDAPQPAPQQGRSQSVGKRKEERAEKSGQRRPARRDPHGLLA